MAATTRKYNPGFLSDEDLIDSFCVRKGEFASIVEMLRECTGSSNPHQIVIGPRGSGKTSLLLRVAAQIRQNAELSSRFFPVVFAEESYEVATAGGFWLECLFQLASQAPRRKGAPHLHRTFEDLRTIRDDRTLADRCLGALLDFSDREDRRLVLMVENVNTMFRDMEDPDAGWRLRKTLQTEPRIVLLASATSRFDVIDDPEQALYDLFRVCTLRPLDTNECADLWEAVAGQRRAPETIRSLEILTGGSPRLLTIVARFGAERSFRELMAELLDLIDDHTEYFKSHIESLPAQERRVYLALADLWKPATAKEIADRARLETSKCSAQLARLVDRGAVLVTGGTARRKQYYLTERLYNIYYLLRRSRGPDTLIEALIHFMASYYSPPELREIGARLIHEVRSLNAEMQTLSRLALARIIELPALAGHREELLAMVPDDLLEAVGGGSAPPSATRAASTDVEPERGLTDRLRESTEEQAAPVASKAPHDEVRAPDDEKPLEDALIALEDVVHRFGESSEPDDLLLVAAVLLAKGAILDLSNRVVEALAVWEEIIRRFGDSDLPETLQLVAMALVGKGNSLDRLDKTGEALVVWDEAVRRFGQSGTPSVLPEVAMSLVNKGAALGKLNRPLEALAACDEVIKRFGESDTPTVLDQIAMALLNKESILLALNRPAEALAACNQMVHRFGESESLRLRASTELALLARADIELESQGYEAATETAGRVLDERRTESPENRCRAYLVRARAVLASGDALACEQDLEAVLAILPELGSFPRENLDALMMFSIEIGHARMSELIQASPSANLLLPLTTALERDLGREPREAREVEEVAQDIRRDLAKLKKGRTDGIE